MDRAITPTTLNTPAFAPVFCKNVIEGWLLGIKLPDGIGRLTAVVDIPVILPLDTELDFGAAGKLDGVGLGEKIELERENEGKGEIGGLIGEVG